MASRFTSLATASVERDDVLPTWKAPRNRSLLCATAAEDDVILRRRLFTLRALLFGTLAVAAVSLGTAAFFTARNADTNTFERKFQAQAEAVLLSFNESLARVQYSAVAFATAAAIAPQPWPNATLPSYDALASQLSLTATALAISFFPLVYNTTLAGFLAFAAANGRPGPLKMLTSLGTLVPVSPTYNPPLYGPTWQTSLAGGMSYNYSNSAVLFDQCTSPPRLAAIQNVVATGEPSLSDIVLVPNLVGTAFALLPTKAPFAKVYAPIIVANSTVGIIAVDVIWSAVFTAGLPSDVESMTAVLVSSGRNATPYTFTISNGLVVSSVMGDAHDTQYSANGRSGVAGIGAMNYTLTLYPTATLQDLSVTDTRVVTTAGAVGVIVFLTFLFFMHDLSVAAVSRRADKLSSQSAALAASRDESALAALKFALSVSRGGSASLSAGARAVAALLPSASCVVVGGLDEGGAASTEAIAVAWGLRWRDSSSASPNEFRHPPNELFMPNASPAAAAAAAAASGGGEGVVDSDECAAGLNSFCDWAPLASWVAHAGCPSAASFSFSPTEFGVPSLSDSGAIRDAAAAARVVALALSAGGRTTGYVVAVFCSRPVTARALAWEGGRGASPSPAAADLPPPPRSPLASFLAAPASPTAFFLPRQWPSASDTFGSRRSAASAAVADAAASADAFGEPPSPPASLPTPPLREACVLIAASLGMQRLEAVIRDGLDCALEATGVARPGASASYGRASSSTFLKGGGGGGGGGGHHEGALAATPPAGASPTQHASPPRGRSAFGLASLAPPSPSSASRLSPRRDGARADNAGELFSLDETASSDALLLRSWALDASAFPPEELHRLLRAMFLYSGLLGRFQVTPLALAAFTADVEASYRGNAFHHWRHAWAVCHAAWLLVESGGMRTAELVDDVGFFALLLAALSHDIDHPGTTNNLEVAMQSLKALTYNDQSVLEHHSACRGFELITRNGLLDEMSKAEKSSFRHAFVSSILATDMSVHKRMVVDVQAVLSSSAHPFARASRDHRTLFLSFVLHCADLSTPLLPPELSRRVAESLSLEFSSQADMERAMGLPVSVVAAASPEAKAAQEISFVRFVVAPLFLTLTAVVPRLGHLLSLLDANLCSWERVAGVAVGDTSLGPADEWRRKFRRGSDATEVNSKHTDPHIV